MAKGKGSNPWMKKWNKINKTIHGMTNTTTYKVWSGMKDRCLNAMNRDYPNYGGRGVDICPSWLKFSNFYADMGNRPNGMFIERIKNNKGYEPGNCRWATMIEQANNKRNNHILRYKGETKTISQWAREKKIGKATIRDRIKRGWNVKEALHIKPSYANKSKGLRRWEC